jgi:AcrR family transcriptional regulator
MSPRPYRLGQRQVAADETRARVLAAARDQLAKETSFSIDAVARRADVARMTVYYQFGSKRGLLEALFDLLAARGGLHQLPDAFRQSDPTVALDHLIDIFARFWSSDRVVMRRLRAMAALDPELDQVLRERAEGLRNGLRVIVLRLPKGKAPVAETVDLLFALTSFENFDLLAGPDRTPEEVGPLVKRAAAAIAGTTPGIAPRGRAR